MEIIFTIVIPIYNAERTLERIITSILNQSFKKYELVLVDDCSTDGSYRIAQKYDSLYPHVHAFQLPSNSGSPKVPREVGVKKAKGDYIVNVDSDDDINQSYLEELYDILSIHPDIDVVIPQAILKDPYNLESRGMLPAEGFDMSQIVSGSQACRMVIPNWTFCCGGMAARSHLYDYANQMNSNRFMNSDELTSRLLLFHAKKVAFSESSKYTYYLYPSSITHKQSVKHFETLYTDAHLIAFTEAHFDNTLVTNMCIKMLSNMICLYKEFRRYNDFSQKERKQIEKIFHETYEFLLSKKEYLPTIKYQLYLSDWVVFKWICAVMSFKKGL